MSGAHGEAPDYAHGIGWAVKCMQNGHRVRRAGWNGKGMWLAHLPAGDFLATDMPNARMQAFVVMKTTDETVVPWLCSQSDLLATDWELAD